MKKISKSNNLLKPNQQNTAQRHKHNVTFDDKQSDTTDNTGNTATLREVHHETIGVHSDVQQKQWKQR